MDMDVRLQRRCWRLVRERMNSNPDYAAGPKALMDGNRAFASTQAMWRFLANPRVTLPQLVKPLQQQGAQVAGESLSDYVVDLEKLAGGLFFENGRGSRFFSRCFGIEYRFFGTSGCKLRK